MTDVAAFRTLMNSLTMDISVEIGRHKDRMSQLQRMQDEAIASITAMFTQLIDFEVLEIYELEKKLGDHNVQS